MVHGVRECRHSAPNIPGSDRAAACLRQGMTLQAAGETLGITRQRVYQLARAAGRRYDPVPPHILATVERGGPKTNKRGCYADAQSNCPAASRGGTAPSAWPTLGTRGNVPDHAAVRQLSPEHQRKTDEGPPGDRTPGSNRTVPPLQLRGVVSSGGLLAPRHGLRRPSILQNHPTSRISIWAYERRAEPYGPMRDRV